MPTVKHAVVAANLLKVERKRAHRTEAKDAAKEATLTERLAKHPATMEAKKDLEEAEGENNIMKVIKNQVYGKIMEVHG